MQAAEYYDDNRIINTDPREQSQQARTGYTTPPHKKSGWFLPVLLLLLVLIAGGLYSTGFLSIHQSTLPERTFAVTGQSKLIVHDGSGSVHIHTSSANTIIVRATKFTMGTDNNGLPVDYIQNGNTVSVSSHDQNSFFAFGGQSVDFDVSVPSTTDLAIDTGSGEIQIATIIGQIKASTGSGDIEASDVTGQATLGTGSGNITVDAAKLSGRNSLHTGSGNIHLTSSLDPHSSYRIDTGSGDVSVSLPANTAFQLETKTGSGTLHNDFGSDQVGQSPYAALSIHVGSGNIELQKQ